MLRFAKASFWLKVLANFSYFWGRLLVLSPPVSSFTLGRGPISTQPAALSRDAGVFTHGSDGVISQQHTTAANVASQVAFPGQHIPAMPKAVTSASYAKVKKQQSTGAPTVGLNLPTTARTIKPDPPQEAVSTQAPSDAASSAPPSEKISSNPEEHPMKIRGKYHLPADTSGKTGFNFAIIPEPASLLPILGNPLTTEPSQVSPIKTNEVSARDAPSSGITLANSGGEQNLPAQVSQTEGPVLMRHFVQQRESVSSMDSASANSHSSSAAGLGVNRMVNVASPYIMDNSITAESGTENLRSGEPSLSGRVPSQASPLASNLVADPSHDTADDGQHDEVYIDSRRKLRKHRKKLVTKEELTSSLYILQLSLLVLSIGVSSVVAMVHCIGVWRHRNKSRVVRIPHPPSTSTMKSKRTLASIRAFPSAMDIKKPYCRRALESVTSTATIAAVSFVPSPGRSPPGPSSLAIRTRAEAAPLSITSISSSKDKFAVSQV